MRNELYWGMVMFFVTGLGSPAYVFYVIYKVSGVIEIRFKVSKCFVISVIFCTL